MRGWSGWSVAAAGWCALFAGLHLYWAAGGDAGLASSAGSDLAERRPAAFVAVGLIGVAVVLLAGIGVVAVAAGKRRPARAAAVLLTVAGILLVLRGVGLEVLLATGAGGVRDAVGPLETRWSLILWNPWFALGGVLLLLAGRRPRDRPR